MSDTDFTILVGAFGLNDNINIRPGCPHIATCAMKITPSTGYPSTGDPMCLNDLEMEALYRAVKAVRKARKVELKEKADG